MLKLLKNLFPFSKELSLAVIFLEYDHPELDDSGKVFKTLQNYLSSINDCEITYLRIDNKNENTPLQKITNNIYTLGGDNQYREFSGWQKGFEILDQIKQDFDLILFVNDMFLAPGESFLKDYASQALLENSLNNNLIIGRIDSTGQEYNACNYNVSKWICTNCFLAPKKAIDKIRDIVTIKDNLDDFLPSTCPVKNKIPDNTNLALNLFKENAPINDTYMLWLVEWLTERWHSKFEINEKNWQLFRTKVRNILNESLLTARLKEAGFNPQVYGDKKYY